MKRKKSQVKRQTRRPAFGQNYDALADLLQCGDAHVWFSPLIGLLGFTVGALALLSESAYSGDADERRLTMLSNLLATVASANTAAREEAQ